jgi:hypothetical protein
VAGVTTTTTNTETYERLDAELSNTPEDSESPQLPSLFWAGVVLFAVNLLILFFIWLSPELRVNMYGEDAEYSAASFRPSPFTETVELAKARKPKQAARVRPVFYEEPALTEFSQSAGLLLPRSSQVAAAIAAADRPEQTVTGAAVDKIVDSYSAFPRVTASLNTVRRESQEAAPRRVSERSARHITIINP